MARIIHECADRLQHISVLPGLRIRALCLGNVAVSASTVAIPVLAYAGAGHRLDDPLARLKDWMEKNNAALLAAVLVLIGLMVLYNGIHAL